MADGSGNQQQQQAQGQQGAGDGGQTQQQQQQAPAIDYDKLAGILEGRQKANEESVLKGYFKQQGLTGEEMAQAIEAFKADRASKAPDVAGMQGTIDALQAQVVAAKVENAVTVAAVQMGIDAKSIPYLARMADLSQVADDQGQVDAEKVSAALSKVLEDVPALKPQVGGQKGFQVGGSGAGDGKPPAKDDDPELDRAFGIKRKN